MSKIQPTMAVHNSAAAFVRKYQYAVPFSLRWAYDQTFPTILKGKVS